MAGRVSGGPVDEKTDAIECPRAFDGVGFFFALVEAFTVVVCVDRAEGSEACSATA